MVTPGSTVVPVAIQQAEPIEMGFVTNAKFGLEMSCEPVSNLTEWPTQALSPIVILWSA